jgi:hypothetical protein
MLSTGTSRRRGPALLASIGLAAILAACGSAGSATSAPAGDAALAPAPAATSGSALFGDESSSGGSGDGTSGNPANLYAPGQDLLIIKTGTMVLQVTDIDAGLASATHQIDALNGYVSGSDRSGDGDSAPASITFRIPAARWDEALTGLRGIATKVLGEQSKTEDVTGQVVDLGARIKNLQATEQALQAIMNRATQIKDVLAVQDELTTVRGQIEDASPAVGAPGAGRVLDAHRDLLPEAGPGADVAAAVRPEEPGRPGVGQPRRRAPGARDRGHLVRDCLAADPDRARDPCLDRDRGRSPRAPNDVGTGGSGRARGLTDRTIGPEYTRGR